MSAAVSVVAVLGTGASLAATPAQAASPWWHLTSGARPSSIQAGQGRDEVQEILFTTEELAGFPTAGFELSVAGTSLGIFATEPLAAEFSVPAISAANIRAALEGPYGAGNVEVTESENPDGSTTVLITAINGGADRELAPVEVGALLGTATAKVLVAGRPDGQVVLVASNLGTAPIDGGETPVKVTDQLPSGLKATSIEAFAGARPGEQANRGPVECSLATLTCSFAGTLPPYFPIEVLIGVAVESAPTEPNQASVTGGGAAPASVSRPVRVGGPAGFGIEEYELANEEIGGGPDTQAGSHPFQQTTTITFNQGVEQGEKGLLPQPVALAKDLNFNWPPGLIGNPTPLPRCTLAQFLLTVREFGEFVPSCPPETAVGVARTVVNLLGPVSGQPTLFQAVVPVFNLEPSFGEPARFGFRIADTPIYIDPSVRSGGDYGLTVSTFNIAQTVGPVSSQVTVWGTPGDPRHDSARGYGCLTKSLGLEPELPCTLANQSHPPPFLFLPTSCPGTPLQTSVEADSWDKPGLFETFPGEPMPALDGCNALPFSPEIAAEPTSDAATSPTGLNFDLSVNDEGLKNSEGLIQSQIKKTVVTLPEGFTINPSVAEGLGACTLASYEAEALGSQPGENCPNSSKVGDVEIESPLVPQKVKGGLFVAKQGENPNGDAQHPGGNLLTIYLIVRNPEIGLLVKQALKVDADPVTGQLTTTADEIPQLPFSHIRISFRTGQRAPLITPPACGAYTVAADLYPYSEPEVPLHRESSFQITHGPEGLPCPSGGVPPFHPNLLAGAENPTAGAYSPFYTDITRKDSEQEITHFSIKLPPGVIGKLAGIPYCPEAGIAAAEAREREGGGAQEEASPSCPAASLIGHSNVGSGVGNVLAYAPGKLYLAGPYHGSNISLVSITAAKVGPVDLGTVVVRFALRINPETAEVFVDSQGSDPIPHIVDGIPVHLRDVQATVDRPEFALNPTSCKKKSTASTILGSGLNFASEADDVPVTVTSPFQVGSCASLGFKPKLALSLKGGTKRGATPAFKAVVNFPKGAYANIAKSVVTLPHSEFLEQSHIKTICTRAQFKEGKVPGEKCPAASVYGRAEAVTPLLSEPLKGPVYLRSSSHNLPDLVVALHNNQVDFALAGRIDSVKGGRIRNTFETVPDAPVSKFVLEMQGGKKGLLVNSTNLCAHTNRAISEFTGQNGKLYNTKPVLQAKCEGKKGKKHRSARK